MDVNTEQLNTTVLMMKHGMGKLSPTEYPIIVSLHNAGLQAILRGDQILIGPPDRISPERQIKINAMISANRVALIAEIKKLSAVACADKVSDAVGCCMNNNRWADSRHDLDKVESLMSKMFCFLAQMGQQAPQYWDGEPAGLSSGRPKPQRPYCYIKDFLVNNEYHYLPILADTDNQDYAWAECDQFDVERYRSI